MRIIKDTLITNKIAKLCIESNCYLNAEILQAYKNAIEVEEDELSKKVLNILIENVKISKNENIPMCQDTGMAVVFVEIGNNVIVDGNLEDAINKGVEKGYREGYLRKSIVKDPINRINTNTNTPAVIHYKIVDGDKLKLIVAPKGFGSENMSAVKMLKPSDGIEGIKKFVIETIKNANSNPCPPIIVGVGIGGTMEKCALIAKEALLRNFNLQNKNEYWAEIEKELLIKINELKIGVGGYGGKVTALGVNINTFPTHIAGLPVAINIGCHITRHSEIII